MSQRYEQRQEERDQDGAVVEELRWPGKRTKVGAAMANAPEGMAGAEVDPRRPDIARIRAAIGGLTSGGGEKLDAGVAGKFGAQLGVDLGNVTVHKDNAGAADLGATAFTHGDQIAFAPGVDLQSDGGQHVLAHELVHVAQNMSAGGSAMDLAARMDVGPSDSPAEAQAEAGASALLAGQAFSAGGVGPLPGISMFEGPPPTTTPAPAGTPADGQQEQFAPNDPRNPDYDPSKDPAVTAQLPGPVNTQQTATPLFTLAPKPQPAPPPEPGAKTPPPGATPTPAPAKTTRPAIGPAPVPTAAKTPASTPNLDELVRAELEKRADPQAKQSYGNATNQIDILRIQAVQYSFQPSGFGTNLLASLWPWESWKQHGREISLTNPYDSGSLQAWIEGARATIRILGDVAAWVATLADIVAAVSGLCALISSWTGAGLVIFGAIATIAAEIGTAAGLIKIILDLVDVLIGIIQMFLTIQKIKSSKDPAQRAKLAALLGREVKEVSGAVVGIGVQVATIVASAGLAAGVSGVVNKSMKGFWANFGKELAKEFRPLFSPKQSLAVIRDAAKLGVRAPKQALRENVDPKTITQKEIADGAVTVERIERRRELVRSNLSRAKRKGKPKVWREIVTKTEKPVLSAKDLKIPKGDKAVTREVRFVVDPNKLKLGIPRIPPSQVENFAVDSTGNLPGQVAGQSQAQAKKTSDATKPPVRSGELPGTTAPAGASPMTQVAMWPSQLELLKTTRAGLPPANDRLMTMYNLAKGQAGPYQAGQFEKVFAGVRNAAGQMRLGALQQQQDASEGAAQSDKGAQTAKQGQTQKAQLDGKSQQMDASTQKIGAQKVEKPPPKEGGSWWDKAKNWLYNQTIGRIGDAIGGMQSWLTKTIGGWVMAQSGLTKEELDMAGIENSMRADHQKDKQTEAEMKAAQDEANKVDPKLAEIMKGANADEQAALQAMMESQEFMTSIDEAVKTLDEAIAAGSTYITEVSPIIQHELDTEVGGKPIDAAYVAPVIGGANAVKGAVGGSSEELAAPAAQDVIDELGRAQQAWPELNIQPGVAQVGTVKQNFVTAHDRLVARVQASADDTITKLQALVGTSDYAAVHGIAQALDGTITSFGTDEDKLVEVYLADLEKIIDATVELIQSAVTVQEVDVPVDQAPVQRKGDGGAANENVDPSEVAARGTQGSGGKLPHLERIQASFGKHDVSGIEAHVGGDARDASAELGAKAFATGNKVAFANSPDLHTAAHEAAHVVQQRSGVSLKAIDGGAGDPHEKHADAVADAVVRGESAEAMLDGSAGGGAAAFAQGHDVAFGSKPDQHAAHEATHVVQQGSSAGAPTNATTESHSLEGVADKTAAGAAAANAKPAKGSAPTVQRKQADAPAPDGQQGNKTDEGKAKADPGAAAPRAASGTAPLSDEVTKQQPKVPDKAVAPDAKGGAKPKAVAKDAGAKPGAKDVPLAKPAKPDAAIDAPAQVPAKPAAAAKPVLPPDVVQPLPVAPVAPVQLAAITSNKQLDDKWIKETGRTPVAHHAQIQSDLDALTAEIQAKQTELMTLADTEATRIGQEISTKVAGFAATVVAPGRARVEAAYGGMTKSIETAEQQAKAGIAAAKTQGTAQIAATKGQKATELTAKFTAAKASNEGVVKKTAPLAVAAIKRFAQSLQPVIDKAKQEAINVTTAMTADAAYDPSQHRASQGLAGGLASLRADIGKNVIVAHGKAVGANYEKKLGSFGKDIDAKAQAVVEEALKPAKQELDIAVDVVSTTTKKSLDAAELTAKSQLDTTEQAASKAVADSKAGALQKWATEKAASIDNADKAGKALSDNTAAAGTELTSRIKKKASEDAQHYGKLAAEIQNSLKSGKPRKYEDVAPKIAAAKQRLATGHQQNVDGLRQLITTGGSELGATLTKQQDLYREAIKTQEQQAKVVEQTLTKDITKSSDDMKASLGGLSQGFDDAAVKQNAALDTAVGEFNSNATAALADFDKKVTQQLTDVKAKLDAELAADLSKEKIAGIANQAIQKELKAKQKAAGTDAAALRTAMDGWGTDENAIYGILRKCSWGEIEFLEATYDNHYDNRGKNGLRPLRYDLWDELGSSELAIAMAYLNHDRKTAIKLELDDSKGWLWNDNKRIESVLRSASEEEITHLNTDPGAVATLASIKNSFWTTDKDVFNTLLDQSMSREERTTKANAIRLFGAMHGWGTDEAEVKRLLEQAATPEERQRLRAQFNQYAVGRGWPAGSGKEGDDALDLALTDDFGSGEVHLVRELAKTERDEQAIKMAKAIEAADGMGTDEDTLFDALDDAEYAKKWKELKAKGDAAALKKLEDEHRAELDAKLKKLDPDSAKNGGIQGMIDGEMEKSYITYDELLAGTRKNGKPVTDADRSFLRDAGSGYLEWMVAQRKLQTGQAEPELMLAYACWGVVGTHEELINKTLGNGGEPKPLSEVKQIAADFKRVWKRNLVDRFEIDNPQGNVPDKDMKFPDPGGVLSAELGGKDWLTTRVLLCGQPETAPQLRYVQKLQVNYAKSGVLSAPLMWLGEATGYTEAGSTQAHSEKKFDAKYNQIAAQLGGNLDITKLAEIGKDKSGNTLKNADGSEQATGDDLQLLSEYLQQDTEAYAKALSSIVDSIVTVLEIVGGIIVTVVTAGTAAPVLAAIIGNLIVSAGTIAFKYAALGDQYGAGDLAKDVTTAAITAGFAGLGEVKALTTMTQNAGKATTGALFRAVNEGVNAGGGRLIGTTIELGPKGIATIQKVVAEGTKNLIISTGTELANALTDEHTYDMKLGEALWGENSIGARLLKNAPRAFAEGAVKQLINDVAGVSNKENKGGHKTALGNMFANMMSDAGANVAGFFLYLDNYNDANTFWDELLKSTGKKAASGFFQGWGMHKMRAKKSGRDFINGEISAAELAEMLSFLDPKEVRELAQFVKKYGGDKVNDLPDQFKKELGAPAPKPADTSTTPAPTAPVTPVASPDAAVVDAADPAATKPKADDAPPADGDPAAKAKADADAAAAAKAKADADALRAQQEADRAKQQQAKPDEPAAKPDDKATKPADDKPVKPADADKPVAAADADKPAGPHVTPDKDLPVPPATDTTTAPVGSHKGKEVFGTHEADGRVVKTTAKDLSTAMSGLGGRKVTVGAIHETGATMEIHVDGPDGKPIKVPVKVVVSDALPPSTHGDDGGAARFSIDHDGNQWTATIHVQQGLHPNDIKFVLGHEVDGISTLVSKHPTGKPATGLGDQMKAGVLGGGTDKATAHDQAGAREIVDLYNEWKKLDKEGSPEAARRKAVLERALEAQGLTDSTHLDAKRKLLAEAGATEDLLDHVSKTATVKKPAVTPELADDDTTTKPVPKDEKPSKEVLELAEKAFQRYAGEIEPAKAILQQIAGELGEVQGRPKDPESAANRLQRAIKNGWAKDGITTVDQAVDNTWDALGTRLVVRDMKDMPQVVARLVEAIEKGQLTITAVNNLHAKSDAMPYMTAEQIKAIAEAQVTRNKTEGKDGKVSSDTGKPMDGGFTGVMIYVQYPSGVRGEIQILGGKVLPVAAIEHIPYDIGLGKPIVRNVDPRVEPEMRAVLGPVEEAVKKVNSDPQTKAAYEKYMAELYKHARNIELGIESTPPTLPDGIDKRLSFEGLTDLNARLDALKKKSKELKAADQQNAVGSAKGKGVYDMATDGDTSAPPVKLDVDSARKLVELHEEIKRLEAAKSPEAEVKKQELARRLADLHGDNLEVHRKLLADANAPAELLQQLEHGAAKPAVKPEDDTSTAKPKAPTTTEAEVTTGDATEAKPSAIKPAVTDADKKNAADLADSVEGLRKTFGDELAKKNTKLVGPPEDRPVLKQGAGDALIGLPTDVISPTADAATAIAQLKKDGIPRWGALTENERRHETAFASVLETHLEAMVGEFYKRSRDDGMNAHVFEVDGAKKLYAAYGGGKAPASSDETTVRATANHALHPAAVAIARLAFLQHLDHLKTLDPSDPQRAILVTNGGCAAGKGSLTGIVKDANGGKFKFGAVWDAAGEGDASENGWILQAAQARGLKVTYGFVESDPTVTYNGVLDRAESTGRIVDPVTFTRSYVKGQENMRAFLESPEYKAALARGEVEAVGVYTGKFDMATKSFPNKRLLGDKGQIGADDINTPPSETEISHRAAQIFEEWLKKQQAAGKPTDHWIEGGIVNPLKFDPAAADGTREHVQTPDEPHATTKPATKPADEKPIAADDPAIQHAGPEQHTTVPGEQAPATVKIPPAAQMVTQGNQIYQHYMDDANFDRFNDWAKANPAKPMPDLAFSGVSSEALDSIIQTGLKSGRALGKTGINAESIWFKAGLPFYADSVTMVIPAARLREMGGKDTVGLAGQKDVMTLGHDQRPDGIPIHEFAIVYSIGHGYVIPLHIPEGWSHPIGQLPPADMMPPGFEHLATRKADSAAVKPAPTADAPTPADSTTPATTTKKSEASHEEPPAPTGSHRGKDVFQPRVDDAQQVVKYTQADLHAGIQGVAGRKGGGADVHVENVSDTAASIRVKVKTDGGETIEVEVALHVSEGLTPHSSHDGDGGSARFTLDPKDGKWKASIELAQGLDPRDIRFVIGHEIDEITDIVQKHPSGRAKVAMGEETVAGVTRDNGRGTKIRSHDVAAAKEIIELFNDWQRLVADGNTPEAEHRKATLDRALKANNLDTLNEAKLALLAEVDAPAALINHIRAPEPTAPTTRAKPPLKLPAGTVPAGLSPAKQTIFEEAAAHHARLKQSAYHGPDFADLAWQQYLRERGIEVEIVSSQVTNQGYKDRAVTASDDLLQREKRVPTHHAEETVPVDTAVGSRSPTLAHMSHDVPLVAFKQMATTASGYKVIGHVDGQRMEIEVTGADGKPTRVAVRLLQPTVVPDNGMAGMRRDGNEIHIWVSDSLPDDQVHRALGAIMGKVVASAKRSPSDGPANPAETAQASAIGQVDALLGHLEVTRAKNKAPLEELPTKLPDGADPEKTSVPAERAKVADRNSKRESEARIAAEIELLLEQHPELVKQMPPDLAAKVETFRKGRTQLGFEPGKVADASQLPKAPVDEQTNRPSTVLPGAPAELRPYSAADRETILQLKVVFETIKEIDARLANRDEDNTSTKHVGIAAGETMRRKEMVAKAQALMAQLQLGGTDPAYYQARLKELDEVFPGAHSAIGEGVLSRVAKRVESDKVHGDAQEYATRAKAKSQDIEAMLAATTPDKPFTCERIVVGDGPTGLANIAGLAEKGVKPDTDGFIDPKKMLVVGGPDLIARMAEADPNMRWGQRPEVFDGEQKHPIFRGGKDELQRATEDTGDFSTVGQMHDAMDLARQRIGVARAQATVKRVELKEQHGGSDWAAADYPVRVVMEVNGKEVVVYTKATDLTTGIGPARLPDEAILAVKDRKKLLDGPDKVMISGEQAMMDADLSNEKVLVFGYGPTGAWAAIESVRRGATSVDWGGSSAQLPNNPKAKYKGDATQEKSGSNESGFADLRKVDRVQEALDPKSKINITTDRIARIEPQGTGAVVTYARGEPPNVTTYQVHYTKVINASAPSTAANIATVSSNEPKAGNIVEGIPLAPQENTQAPVYTSKGDPVRVMGPAADGISGDNVNKNKTMDQEMAKRRDQIPRVADSPDHRVMEATGTAVDLANGIDPKAAPKSN